MPDVYPSVLIVDPPVGHLTPRNREVTVFVFFPKSAFARGTCFPDFEENPPRVTPRNREKHVPRANADFGK